MFILVHGHHGCHVVLVAVLDVVCALLPRLGVRVDMEGRANVRAVEVFWQVVVQAWLVSADK